MRENTDTPPSLETEIFRLINRLMAVMGYDDYCHWLAAETPVEWLTVTPYAEIRARLSAKLQELK
jgi:hypothetical protein